MKARPLDNTRVLHRIGCYLPVTENWIYPQVACVPGAQGAVLCQDVVNPSTYPLKGAPLFVQQSSAARHLQGMRMTTGALRGALNVTARLSARFGVWLWAPAVIHAHFGTMGWASLRLKKVLGVPMITSFYGYDAWSMPTTNPEWRSRYVDLFDQGELFLVEGPAFRQRLIELGCAPEKVHVQKLGVDPNSLTYRRRDFSDELKVVMIGRFVEKKGFVEGLRACAKVAASGHRIVVTIIGDCRDDAAGQMIKRDLVSLAQSEHLAGRVRFEGFRTKSEVEEILTKQDVFLCPSKHASSGDAEGGLPVVLLEAMAMGLLCVGSRHCDIPEAIRHGRTGFLFEEGDVEQMSETLCGIAEHRSQLSEVTGLGRKHIEENFDISKQLAGLSEFYRRCAMRHGRVVQ